jgi:hypothetical protein
MSVHVRLEGMTKVKAMLGRYDDQAMQNRVRKAARAGIAVFRPALRAEAASRFGASGDAHVPASFRKTKTRTSTRGGASGRDIVASVRPSSPLFNIFEPGASPHTIAPRGGKGLGGPAGPGGWTSEGRKRPRRFGSRRAVQHPGMSSRAMLPGVFAEHLSRAEDAVAAAIFGDGSVSVDFAE